MKEEPVLKLGNTHVPNEEIKVKLYSIESSLGAGDAVIDINDPKGRISSYFIWGEGDGSFLKFMTPKGKAQSGIRATVLSTADFIPANIGVPIFSERVKKEIERLNIKDINWHAIDIDCAGKIFNFYLCKVGVLLNLVDEDKSVFRVLSEGERILSKVVYKNNVDYDFMIARDINFKERLVVSQGFVELCKSKGLRMEFFNTELS
ncbi:TPA: hypothetical protein SLG40_002152 [Serratia odorifera]|nr:hypothetical protein [Serratia odorifera]